MSRKMITKFKDFLKLMEAKHYEYGCVMLEIPIKSWDGITNKISKEDIYEDPEDDTYGIEKYPHLTLLYGLHNDVTLDDVKECFKGIKSIDVKINGIGIFQNQKFDVVKLNIEKTPQLQSIFDRLSLLPNSNAYRDYIPHITISYLNSGLGKKYVDSEFTMQLNGLNKICYSTPDGGKQYFYL